MLLFEFTSPTNNSLSSAKIPIRKIDCQKLDELLPLPRLLWSPNDILGHLKNGICRSSITAPRRKSKPWFKRDCYTAKKAFERFKYSNDLQKMASLKRAYKQVCTAALSRWHRKHQEVFLDNVIKDRNFLWKFVKSKRG